MTGVLVTGAAGKMGALSAQTIAAQDDLHLVALVDPKGADAVGDAPCFAGVEQALALTSPQAALEFSVPAAVFENTRLLLEAGVPTVVGTTGLLDDQVGVLSAAAEAAGVGLVIVPNFALGAVLLMRFAAEAARYYEHAEIIELHEAGKVDAPSGTSLRTARLMAEAPGSALRDAARRPALARPHGRPRPYPQRAPARRRRPPGGPVRRRRRGPHAASRLAVAPLVHERRALALRRVPEIEGTVVGLENLLD